MTIGLIEQINKNENGISVIESIQKGSWLDATLIPRGATVLTASLEYFEGRKKSDNVE